MDPLSFSAALPGLLAATTTLVVFSALRWHAIVRTRARARRRLASPEPRPAGARAHPSSGARVRLLARLGRSRSAERLERSLPAALEGMARSVRSGASLRQAVEEVARAVPDPLGTELRRVAAELKAGASLASALDSLAGRSALPGVRLAVTALSLGNEWGGSTARGLDGVAVTLRERFAVADEIHALGAQARMSALVISLAPLAFGAFAVATDPRTATFLLGTPLGIGFVLAGVLLDAAGWLWMRRLSGVRR